MPAQYRNGPTTANELAERIERDIVAGRRQAGDRLPPIRALADELGMSPSTVAAAYGALAQRALVVTDGRRGTRIARRAALRAPLTVPLPPDAVDVSTGNPDPALLPDLGRAAARAARTTASDGTRLYTRRGNDDDLLDLAREDFRDDGVLPRRATTDTTAIAVVNGAMDGVERVLAAHLRTGDRVIVEDPAYPAVVDVIAALGLSPVPVPVDDDGPVPDALSAALAGAGVRAIVLTPRAQNPFGAALTARRRAALAALIERRPDVVLVEDDHAAAVGGAPMHSLAPAAAAVGAPWAVVRSVSKAYGPDLRLAVIAGDTTTVGRVESRQAIGPGWVSHLTQRIVVELLADDGVRRRVERARETYARRRQAFVDALAQHGIAAHGRSGFNVWIPVPEEAAVVAGLLQRGWAVRAGEGFRIRTGPAIRVTTASLGEHDAASLARDLAALVSVPSHRRPARQT